MAEENKNKAQLIKFTWIALGVEIILIILPFILANTDFPEGFFGFWLIGTAVINLALAISHIVSKTRRYALYVLILIAIPLIPVVILLSAMSRMEC